MYAPLLPSCVSCYLLVVIKLWVHTSDGRHYMLLFACVFYIYIVVHSVVVVLKDNNVSIGGRPRIDLSLAGGSRLTRTRKVPPSSEVVLKRQHLLMYCVPGTPLLLSNRL